MSFSNTKRAIGLSLAAMLVVAGCSFGGQSGTGSSSGGGKAAGEDPKQVLRTMQDKAQNREMNKGSVNGKVTVDLSSAEGKGTFSLDLNSKFNIEKKDDEKVMLGLKLNGSGDAQGMKGSGNAALDMLITAKTFFGRLNELKVTADQQPELQQQLDLLVKPYMNQWFKIPLPQNPFAMETQSSGLTKDQEDKIKEEVKKTDFFTVEKDNGVVKVNGVDTRELKLKLNVDNTANFAKKVGEITGKTVTDSDLSEFKEAMKKITFEGTVNIGAADYYLYKVSMNIAFQDPNSQANVKITGELTVDPKDPGALTEPADAKEFPVGGMMGPAMGAPGMMDSGAMMPGDSSMMAPANGDAMMMEGDGQ